VDYPLFTYKILRKKRSKTSNNMEIFDIIGILLTPTYKYKTFKYYFKVTYGNYFVDWLTSLKEETIFLNIGANQG